MENLAPETYPICAIIEFDCSIQSDVSLILGRQRDKSTGECVPIFEVYFDREFSLFQELIMVSEDSELQYHFQ
jgi:hypothetical protein